MSFISYAVLKPLGADIHLRNCDTFGKDLQAAAIMMHASTAYIYEGDRCDTTGKDTPRHQKDTPTVMPNCCRVQTT